MRWLFRSWKDNNENLVVGKPVGSCHRPSWAGNKQHVWKEAGALRPGGHRAPCHRHRGLLWTLGASSCFLWTSQETKHCLPLPTALVACFIARWWLSMIWSPLYTASSVLAELPQAFPGKTVLIPKENKMAHIWLSGLKTKLAGSHLNFSWLFI